MKLETKSNLWRTVSCAAGGWWCGCWALVVVGLVNDLYVLSLEQTVTNFMGRLGLVFVAGKLSVWAEVRAAAAFEAMCVEDEAAHAAELTAEGYVLGEDNVWRKPDNGMPWCDACQGYHYSTAPGCRKGGA